MAVIANAPGGLEKKQQYIWPWLRADKVVNGEKSLLLTQSKSNSIVANEQHN